MKKLLTAWLFIISITLIGCSKKTDIKGIPNPVSEKQSVQSNKSLKIAPEINIEKINHLVSMAINHKGSDGQSLKGTVPYSNNSWHYDKTFSEPFFINTNHYKLITTKEYLNKIYEDTDTSNEIKTALKTQNDFMNQMQFYAGQVNEMVNAGRYTMITPIILEISAILQKDIPQIPWANEQRIKIIMSNLIMLIKEGNAYYSRAYDIYSCIKENYSVLNKQLNELGNSSSELSQLKKMIKEYYTLKFRSSFLPLKVLMA